MAQFIEAWKQRADELRTDVYAVYLARKDPRVPLSAKIFAACVVGYVFSPIDLIPDFIPVLGYLDDLVLVPLGVAFSIRMIPPVVMAEYRDKAQEVMRQGRPANRTAAVIVLAIWLLLATVGAVLVARFITR
jgi:uncharacterized membrane protein YkvA (DUF1232 family)